MQGPRGSSVPGVCQGEQGGQCGQSRGREAADWTDMWPGREKGELGNSNTHVPLGKLSNSGSRRESVKSLTLFQIIGF